MLSVILEGATIFRSTPIIDVETLREFSAFKMLAYIDNIYGSSGPSGAACSSTVGSAFIAALAACRVPYHRLDALVGGEISG